MKKFVGIWLICVIFILFSNQSLTVFASTNESLDFIYNNRIFNYQLEKNIKQSNIFIFNYELNKYNRFGSTEERKELLRHMLEIGFDKQIALEYIFPNIGNIIEKIENNLYIKPQDATLKINTNSQKVFHINKEIMGIKLNKNALFDSICENYLNNKSLTFNIPTTKLMPNVVSNDFKKFTNLRGEFSTDISSSSADRKHNIKNALNSLNKIEIMPNEIFSFNKTIGKRTAENGYRQAKIIVNNEFVDGFGGGVCQVSSTLYNTALLSGLEILEANKHSKQVGYIKYGFDAMVNFGSSDLKFRNNTSEKITIITNYSSSTLRIRMFGQSLGNTQYKLTNEIISTTEPIELVEYDTNLEHTDKVMYEDECFYLKKPSRGMEIKSYREKYINGVLQNKELLRFDKFKVQNGVKIFGIKKRESENSLSFLLI